MTETHVIVIEALLPSVIASEAPRTKQSPAPFPLRILLANWIANSKGEVSSLFLTLKVFLNVSSQ